MKRVLVDTDICLDLLTGREPHVELAVRLFGALSAEGSTVCVSVASLLDLHYFLKKTLGEQATRSALDRFRTEVEVLPVGEKAFVAALRSPVADFEDAVQVETAKVAKVDLILTRNIKDYKRSSVRALRPEDYLGARRPPFST